MVKQSINHAVSLETIMKNIGILAIKSYRGASYPFYSLCAYLHIPTPQCRFTPTCSHYAEEAIREWGAVKGTVLSMKRLLRCTPYSGFGHDPVPKRQEENNQR